MKPVIGVIMQCKAHPVVYLILLETRYVRTKCCIISFIISSIIIITIIVIIIIIIINQIITAKSGDGTNYQFRDDWM